MLFRALAVRVRRRCGAMIMLDRSMPLLHEIWGLCQSIRDTVGERMMLARLLDAWFSFVFGLTIKYCLAPLLQLCTWRPGPVVAMAIQHQDRYCNMRFALLVVAASTRLVELERM